MLEIGKTEFRTFFFKGMQQKSSDLQVFIDLVDVNLGNKNLSDKDFRKLVGDINKQMNQAL
jgi:hypothetical protein